MSGERSVIERCVMVTNWMQRFGVPQCLILTCMSLDLVLCLQVSLAWMHIIFEVFDELT